MGGYREQAALCKPERGSRGNQAYWCLDLDFQPPDLWQKIHICCLSHPVSGTFLLAWGDLMKLHKVQVFKKKNYFVLCFFRKNTMSEGIVVNIYDLHMWILMVNFPQTQGGGQGPGHRSEGVSPVSILWWLSDGRKAGVPMQAKQWWSHLKDFFLVWAVPCRGIFIKLKIL